MQDLNKETRVLPGAGTYQPGTGTYRPGTGTYRPGAGTYQPGAATYQPGAGTTGQGQAPTGQGQAKSVVLKGRKQESGRRPGWSGWIGKEFPRRGWL